jgi:hypothetical protein
MTQLDHSSHHHLPHQLLAEEQIVVHHHLSYFTRDDHVHQMGERSGKDTTINRGRVCKAKR